MLPCAILTDQTCQLLRSFVIQCTSRHFVPVGSSVKNSRATYAKDVSIGDHVLLVNEDGAAVGTVIAKQLVTGQGLYNPYTKVSPGTPKCLASLNPVQV